jgi:hypothetical protein
MQYSAKVTQKSWGLDMIGQLVLTVTFDNGDIADIVLNTFETDALRRYLMTAIDTDMKSSTDPNKRIYDIT